MPGEVRGQYEAWKRHGWLPWKQLVQPAIDLARNGFEISQAVADVLTKEMETDIRNDPGLRLVNASDSDRKVAKVKGALFSEGVAFFLNVTACINSKG